jgi:hypothetical protein
LAGMTPEERERFMERMRARGLTLPAEAQTAAAKPTAVPSRAQGGATTFDALFGPLTSTESFGQVWLHQGGNLQRIRLTLGITDGQQTELIQATEGNIQEGTEVVTNVTIGAVRQTATPAPTTAFPGLEGDRGFRGGGFQGGGRGRGGGRGQ